MCHENFDRKKELTSFNNGQMQINEWEITKQLVITE